MAIRSILKRAVQGERLVVRADLNAPMKDGVVTDTTRIDRFAAGLKPLLEAGARVVVISHFGRPKGKRVPEMSLRPIAPVLAAALGRDVAFVDDCIGAEAVTAAKALKDSEVLLCENLRFHAAETKNDADFAEQLADLGQIYVNDAFSSAHRAHASTVGITEFLPSFAGALMGEETDALMAALEAPERPSVAIVGGAKVSSKISVLENLVKKLDAVIIGGGMANTFLAARGLPVGKSLFEMDLLDVAKRIEAEALAAGCNVVLPVDLVVAREFAEDAENQIVAQDACPEDAMILDAGPKSILAFSEVLDGAKTILWNGPLGAFETRPFDRATVETARIAASLTKGGKVTSVAGGGDTVAALKLAGVERDFSYISSAGGAFLEWLEGKELPGIAALDRAWDSN